MILSCDPGVDDALAIALLRAWPELSLHGVVAQGGNCPRDDAVRNTAGLVQALGLDVPVGRGSGTALRGPFPGHATEVHGDDGLGGASPLLPSGAAVSDDGIAMIAGDVIATGPLTDVARALEAGASITSVDWMGGSLREGGNVTPHAEFNAWCDPDAAQAVFDAAIPVRVVPLDVTHRVRLGEDEADALAEVPLLHAIASHMARGDGYLHDPVAIVAALHPDLFGWEGHRLRCVITESERGATVSDGPGSVEVATTVDAEAVHGLVVDALVEITRLSFSS